MGFKCVLSLTNLEKSGRQPPWPEGMLSRVDQRDGKKGATVFARFLKSLPEEHLYHVKLKLS